MENPSSNSKTSYQFLELRQKARNILDQLGDPHIDTDNLDRQNLLEELNVYHIELELQHEELQNTRDKLEASQKYLDDLYSYAPIGYVVMSIDGKIQDVNECAARYFQLDRRTLKGQRLQSFVPHESLLNYNECLTKALDRNSPQYTEVKFRIREGQLFWARVDLLLISNPSGSGNLILCSLLDITAKKEIEQELVSLNHNLESLVNERTRELQKINIALEKEIAIRKQAEHDAKAYAENQKVLLRELNHRVKNNMQIIISLMKLQAKQADDPNIYSALLESQNRIKALAMIHEFLYMAENLATIPFKQYLEKLSRHISSAFSVGGNGIAITCSTDIPALHIDQAVPMGLAITELITNAIKHAFPEKQKGNISISAKIQKNKIYEVVIGDDGIGLPEDLTPDKHTSLGLRLVHRIVEDQLSGTVKFDGKRGTHVTIQFPQKQA